MKTKPKKVKVPKVIDLDAELQSLGSWHAYGVEWVRFQPTEGTKTPDCTAENPCLRTGWYSFDNSKDKTKSVGIEFTVSDSHAVVVQGLTDPFRARLLAAAPALLRFAKAIADGEASTLSVVDDARELVAEITKPIHVAGFHDSTVQYEDEDGDEGYSW